MKLRGIFDLTKREQRVVIVIVLMLLIGTLAARYRNFPPQLPSPPPTAETLTPDREEDSATPDESP
jgi:hypothetical protein